MKRIAYLVATWFGSGLIPPVFVKGMAGTYGSLAAVPLCLLGLWSGSATMYVALMLIVLVAGEWSIDHAEQMLGPRIDWHGKTKTRDQNQIVIDEVLGVQAACMPLIFFPFDMGAMWFWAAIFVGFVMFRIFDIKKPPIAKQFDELHTSMGVMLDDLIAGWYAAVFVYLTVYVLK